MTIVHEIDDETFHKLSRLANKINSTAQILKLSAQEAYDDKTHVAVLSDIFAFLADDTASMAKSFAKLVPKFK